MNTEHTPGPWATDIEIAADLIRSGDSTIEQAAVYVNHGSGKGGEICAFRHDPSDGLDLTDVEHQANARLIAAAPDLLAALQKLLENAGDCLEVEAPSSLCDARAAIAKATGQ